MPPEKDKPIKTQADAVKQAAAIAKEEVLSQSAMDALLNATPDSMIKPSEHPEVVHGNANSSGGWMHGPAHLELFAAADKRLTRAASLDGMQVSEVERVYIQLVPGTKLLVIKPAEKTDLAAIRVNRYAGQSSAWINCISLLGEESLTVETGYKERHDIAYIPKASALWPGLVLDLGHPRERATESVSGKKATATKKSASAKSASAQNTKEAAKPESTPNAGTSEVK